MNFQLYLIKTHRINLTNLFIGMLNLNEKNRAYETCYYELVDDKFFKQCPGGMAKGLVRDPFADFRNFPWSNNIEKLNTLLSISSLQNKILTFGNHKAEELIAIKNHCNDKAITIGINYTEDIYPLLLTNVAEYHIWLLKHNRINKNEQDQYNLDHLTYKEQVDYYTHAFNEINLIPRSNIEYLDYNINVEDFFSESKLYNHFANIGINLNNETKQYYRTWQSSSL